MKYSIIIPIHNEAGTIEELLAKIIALKLTVFEVIMVDDGSTDNYAEVLKKIFSKYQDRYSILNIRHDHKKGQTQALFSGVDRAKYENIITLDGNMKHDPIFILDLVKKYEDGFDMIVGVRKNRFRDDKKPLMTFYSLMANIVISKLFKIKILDITSTFKVFKKAIMENIPQMLIWPGLHRYLPIIAKFQGVRQISTIDIKTKPRKYGYSKYSVIKYLAFVRDLKCLRQLKRRLKKEL
jgi:glycosyltransferase involved in cell wall biosynthesis